LHEVSATNSCSRSRLPLQCAPCMQRSLGPRHCTNMTVARSASAQAFVCKQANSPVALACEGHLSCCQQMTCLSFHMLAGACAGSVHLG
jgi:hypothetical protein